MNDGDELVSRTSPDERRPNSSLFLLENRESYGPRLNASINASRRLSNTVRVPLPNVDKYRGQERIPPSGIEFSQRFFQSNGLAYDGLIRGRRLSTTFADNYGAEDEEDEEPNAFYEDILREKKSQKQRRLLFLLEPIIVGVILLPMLVLYWQCGWNIVVILLNTFSRNSSSYEHNRASPSYSAYYSVRILIIPYVIVQVLLAILYLSQDFLYDFLKRTNRVFRFFLLKFHILLLGSIYIVQWVALWTIWDQYTPDEWYFKLALSCSALLALIVLIGHLSDLICAPFLISYDVIDYCIQFGCPLLTRQIYPWKINLVNYVLYEILISNIAVIAWRGFYHFLDKNLYSNDLDKSSRVCLLIGYVIYFPLMYLQSYLEGLNLKYEFWRFVSINFPQLYRNTRHLSAFLSCVFLWRGIWMICDAHLPIFRSELLTSILFHFIVFLFLALIQTSSSINGPMSNIEDENHFFPLYPNCYVSIMVRNFSRFTCFRR